MHQWSVALGLTEVERSAWRDVARWHDALRDAPVEVLRALTGNDDMPERVLHGPAAAVRLQQEGETRHTVLEAIRWHTLGLASWDRTGQALYMADFLEPGRTFATRDRAFLASLVPLDFDGVFRQVVRLRIEWTLREGKSLFPETVELWNYVR